MPQSDDVAKIFPGATRPSFTQGEEAVTERPAVSGMMSLLLSVVVVAVVGVWWFSRFSTLIHERLEFDDAYMFYRYAMNIRHGYGMSWNTDGVHTYGQTAPLWGLVILVMSYLPYGVSKVMFLSSIVCSFGAFLSMGWAVAWNATSRWISETVFAVLLVALPLMTAQTYYANAGTGMETMLAALLGGLYVGLVLGWQRGKVLPEMVSLVGLLLFLTRPEAVIVVLSMPVLAYVLLTGISKRGLTRCVGAFLGGLLLDLVVCKLYFHTALPLSFYMKSMHGYVGYAGQWKPIGLAYQFLVSYKLYVIALVVFARRSDWRLLTVCLVPALMTFGYLLTVTQIMGFDSRYYMPYLAFLVVPALLVLDRRLAEVGVSAREQWTREKLLVHGAGVALILVGCYNRIPAGVTRILDRELLAGVMVYDAPVLHTAATTELPRTPYVETMWRVTDTLVEPLPPGATVAVSEVGFLGAHAMQANIIDIAGLNDAEIALHGFRMDELLARRPDILWLPHPDYTYQRVLILSDPSLLEQYDVYAGAANYGLAIRKSSPYRAQIEKQMQMLWSKLYSGYRMEDYLVRSVTYTTQKHLLFSRDELIGKKRTF